MTSKCFTRLFKYTYVIILPCRNDVFIVYILTVLLWFVTLREEHRLKALESRVLRRIFGPKRDEVTGDWRKMHSDELRDLYSSTNIVWVIKSRRRWVGHVARMGERRVQGFGGKRTGKEPIWKT
jgi:hypothetical protein